MRTDTKTLIEALRILARDIESGDGVANACIAEATDRLEELTKPQWYSDQDGDVAGDWDYVANWHDLEVGKVLHLQAHCQLGEAYVANLPVADEDDGEYKLFATRQEAEKAIADAGKTV